MAMLNLQFKQNFKEKGANTERPSGSNYSCCGRIKKAIDSRLFLAQNGGGTNDNDDHACEPNNIIVQNKIIPKILPLNKFTTLKFLSLLPSTNGFFFPDYYVLLCNTCLYRSVHKHGHHCHSSPLAGVRFPRRAAGSCSSSGHKQRC